MANPSTESVSPDCACGMVSEGYPGPCSHYRYAEGEDFCVTCDHHAWCHDDMEEFENASTKYQRDARRIRIAIIVVIAAMLAAVIYGAVT